MHNQHGAHQDLVDALVHRQNEVELQQHLEALHPADIAFILESLPLDDRLAVWQLCKSERDGEILLEVSDAVRESLIADMDQGEIMAAVEPLDADELADLVEDLPTEVLPELMASLDAQQRERVQSALSYEEDQLGALMDFEMVTIREDVSLETVLRYLRRFEELPAQTDKLFVVNHDNLLTGVLPLHWLLVNSPDKMVGEMMAPDVNTFHPHDDAYEVAQAFERYDLVTAPVVDEGGHLIGRITVDAMVDVIREEGESEALSRGGLREEEDIFASVWASVRNRWSWLAINLVTAFLASRVIGLFENSIEKLVALATLMPIVAGIGGNSGNQTITMIVRASALDQVNPNAIRRLWHKELGVALFNGLIWGGVIGLVAGLLYHSPMLGAGDDRRDDAQSAAGGLHGRGHSDGDDSPRPGSGAGLERVPDLHDRQRRFLHFPWPGYAFPDLGRHFLAGCDRRSIMSVSELPTAFGQPPLTARLRATPEDFLVEEILGYDAEGEGEHAMLWVEKRGANTDWVARELAKFAGVSPMNVGYAGLKDRHAVTRQTFSVQLPGKPDPDWSAFPHAEVKVLAATRHSRKLKRGALRGNRFVLVLRDVEGDARGRRAGAAADRRARRTQLFRRAAFRPRRRQRGAGAGDVRRAAGGSGQALVPALGGPLADLQQCAGGAGGAGQLGYARWKARSGRWPARARGSVRSRSTRPWPRGWRAATSIRRARCGARASRRPAARPASWSAAWRASYPDLAEGLAQGAHGSGASRAALDAAGAALALAGRRALELGFELPAGAYATVVVRELARRRS